MTSKLVVNTIEADTGISSVSFGSSISLSSTSKFFFSNAGIDIGADTNINRPASGVLGFNINGSEKARIDSSGRVLIGTTTEGHANADDLTIATTDHTGITLRSATNRNGSVFFSDGTSGADEYRGWIQYTHTSDYLTFGTNGSEKLRIDSSGRMMIGTTAASTLTSSDDLTISTSGSTGITLFSATGNAGNIAFGDGTSGDDRQRGLLQYHHSDNSMRFFTNAAERLRIESGGDVDIKNGVLKLGSGANRRLMYRSGNNDVILEADSGDFYRQDIANSTHEFYTGNNIRLKITSAGYFKLGSTDGGAWHTIRINTTTNNAIKDVLHVHSSVDSATAAAGFGVRLNFVGEQLNGNEYVYGGIAGLLSGTGSNYGDLAFYTNNNGTNTERLRITAAGDVGINQSTPNAKLHVNGTSTLGGDVAIPSGHKIYTNNSGANLTIQGGASYPGSAIKFNGGTNGGTGIMHLYAGQTNSLQERVRINANGIVQKYNNPSFRAGLNSNTTFASSADIVFNDTSATWHHNNGNHYNTSNGRFTAPVEGVYHFDACVIFGPNISNNLFMGDAFLFYINNGYACYSGRRGYYVNGTTGNQYYTDHISCRFHMMATDYITVRNGSPWTGVHGNTYYTWFGGTLLG